jgi:hypothetical protein
MKFWRKYLRNLALMTVIFGGFAIFAAVFYPETLSVFWGIGQVYSGLNLWPIVVLGLLIAALPRKRH